MEIDMEIDIHLEPDSKLLLELISKDGLFDSEEEKFYYITLCERNHWSNACVWNFIVLLGKWGNKQKYHQELANKMITTNTLKRKSEWIDGNDIDEENTRMQD